jgi:hypothetical protein
MPNTQSSWWSQSNAGDGRAELSYFNEWLLELTSTGNPELQDSVISITSVMQELTYMLLVPLGIAGLIWSFVKKGTETENSTSLLDVAELRRVVILIMAIYWFIPLFTGISGLIDGINRSASKAMYVQSRNYEATVWNRMIDKNKLGFDEETKRRLKENFTPENVDANFDMLYQEKQEQNLREGKEVVEASTFGEEEIGGAWDLLSADGLKYILRRQITDTFVGLAALLGTAVKFGIGLLIVGLDKLLFCLGVLAFGVSLMPIFKDKWIEWIGVWLVVKASFLSFSVVDGIVMNLTAASSALYPLGETHENLYMDTGISIMSIVLYCLVFYTTSKFIGDGRAGRFLTATVAGMMAAGKAVGKAATGMATGGASAGAGAGAGMLSGVSNVLRKGIKEKKNE